MPRKPSSYHQSMLINISAAVVFAVTVCTIAAVAPAAAQDAPVAAEVQNASWLGGHGGWWGKPSSAAAHCEKGVDHFVEEMMEHAEEEVEFTATQESAWNDLIAAVREGGKDVTAFCGKVDEARSAEAAPAPQRLAMAEEAVAVGLKTIQKIRPAFDAFYATLDAEQKELLDGETRHHRRGWWH